MDPETLLLKSQVILHFSVRQTQFEIKTRKLCFVVSASSLLNVLFEVNGDVFSVAQKADQLRGALFSCLVA